MKFLHSQLPRCWHFTLYVCESTILISILSNSRCSYKSVVFLHIPLHLTLPTVDLLTAFRFGRPYGFLDYLRSYAEPNIFEGIHTNLVELVLVNSITNIRPCSYATLIVKCYRLCVIDCWHLDLNLHHSATDSVWCDKSIQEKKSLLLRHCEFYKTKNNEKHMTQSTPSIRLIKKWCTQKIGK